MADISNKEAIKRFDRVQGNGVMQTLLEIVIALLFAIVLATILDVLTF